MADEYVPQDGQCCGECKHWDNDPSAAVLLSRECRKTGLVCGPCAGTVCTIFDRREQPKPVEPVTVTFERIDNDSVCFASMTAGSVLWCHPALANILRDGPVTVQIPPAPCGECAGLREKRDAALGEWERCVSRLDECRAERDAALVEADTAKRALDKLRNDFVRASDALLTNTSKLVASEREAEQLREECAGLRAATGTWADVGRASRTARAEAEKLRARLIERNEEIERLGNALARIYGNATVVSVQSDNLRDTVLAELNSLNATL